MKKKIGHFDQVAFVRPITYTDGRAKGLDALQFYNGVLDFTVLKNRCMDIGDMRYKGTNIAFFARSGLMAPQIFDLEWNLHEQSGLMGGFMFTCGLSNTGSRCEEGGLRYPCHGQIRATAAEECRWGTEQNGKIRLYAQGKMSEAVLQGIHLTLRREIETNYLRPGFTIADTITNEGYKEEPVLLVYHTNFGWPLLDEDTRVVIPSEVERRERMSAPQDDAEEIVIAHNAIADEHGYVVCRVENDRLGIGASMTYLKDQLPCLGEWRSEVSGDYVTGIEPGICGVEGRAELLKSGKARFLKPGESLHTRIDFCFYDL